MNPAPPIVDTVLAAPRPVLFVDTCILLDVIRSPSRSDLGVQSIQAASKLLQALQSQPPACYVVASSILPTEFGQNEAGVCDEVTRSTQTCQLVLDVGVTLGVTPTFALATAAVSGAAQKLARSLRDTVLVLPPDNTCLERAFGRVLNKKAPAAGGKIKDAYIVEQCLAFARSLHRAGYQPRRVFCSSNKSDFLEPPTNKLHSHLSSDFTAHGLEFFASLDAAVGSLRL